MWKNRLKTITKNNFNYIFITVLLAVFVLLNTVGLLNSRSFLTPNMIVQISYTIILVVSLNLVVGILGELSLGHAGFMYVGAYASALFSHYVSSAIPNSLLRIILSILVGGIVAAVFGLIIGLPALRLRGDYLAIVTLAFGEIIRGVLKNIKIPGVIDSPTVGVQIPRFGQRLFIVAMIAVLFTLFCIQNFVGSKHGRAIIAIRDNEIAARTMGINITYYKLTVFSIAAFFAGIAGVLFANYSNVSFQTFSYNYSIEILVMVVLGGMGSITGSIFASIFLVMLNSELQSVLSGNMAGFKYFVYALVLIFVMIFNTSPKMAAFKNKFSRKNIWSFIVKKILRKKTKAKETNDELL